MPSSDETLYEVLGVLPDVADAELRQAYKQQALKWHPDKNSDPEAEARFKRINTAWRVLSDEYQRAAYDASLLRDDGEHEDIANGHAGARHHYQDADASACYNAWQEFLRAEERERKAQKRRERSCLVGVISLLIWVSSLVLILWQFADDSQILFP